MGKGDKKSKKGKIWRGSYGVLRSKKSIKARLKRLSSKPAAAPAAEEKPKPKRASRKKEASAE